MRLAFTVLGPPQPKERARKGKDGRWYTPERTRVYESALRKHAILKAPRGWPTDARYRIEVTAFFQDRRRRDIDNVMKCSDAFNKVLWADDDQVDELEVKRRFDKAMPRTEFVIIVLGVL